MQHLHDVDDVRLGEKGHAREGGGEMSGYAKKQGEASEGEVSGGMSVSRNSHSHRRRSFSTVRGHRMANSAQYFVLLFFFFFFSLLLFFSYFLSFFSI